MNISYRITERRSYSTNLQLFVQMFVNGVYNCECGHTHSSHKAATQCAIILTHILLDEQQ